MTTAETALAYAACRDLRALYEAYQFASRAHRLVLRRPAPPGDRSGDPDENLRIALDLADRDLLAAKTDATFAHRAAQLRERMLSLRGFPVVR